MMQKFRLPVIIERDENGNFVTECLVLKGCYTQRETLGEEVGVAGDSKGRKFDAR
ncbi:type II toxin-antitoxin system HicB family antitoxin [Fervidibacter sacchari]